MELVFVGVVDIPGGQGDPVVGSYATGPPDVVKGVPKVIMQQGA